MSGTAFATGCGKHEATVRHVTFENVEDHTGTGLYTVGSTAEGTSDEFGNVLTVQIAVHDPNQSAISPRAEITFGDGQQMTCKIDDPRDAVYLVPTTTDAQIPCAGQFPATTTNARVVVTDDYN